ncbi:hypothetical protein [Paenibacillus sp.]|jgi:nucleotidyltransferase/DNA polymerase involved in DNA repair|uniref:DinB/UmuC family translesion DNA polymerase n=1 Tax=Paenibacillus sp. TaxID=58172 RepID=UPI00282439DE|nr:hypothetical protein [Paenibacillus sp.]MDR0271389.1 hypothetical protein [Paenibacillus sp.]
MKLPDPTNITQEVNNAAKRLFYQNWNGLPVRRVGVSAILFYGQTRHDSSTIN